MSSELPKYGSTSVVQTSNIGFTSEVSDYLVVHTGPEQQTNVTTAIASPEVAAQLNAFGWKLCKLLIAWN